ncbi:ABC transporter [Pluteus cervinus]|uniref:ABC transporter n=1 Tax=Pluteus cervinus TaxID=181527 RepID=A0ACD3B5K6_9AGAR|nr:ABC transporter [Pluteus cervinus]
MSVEEEKAQQHASSLPRRHPRKFPFVSAPAPPPPPQSLADAAYIPEATANWFSLVTFGWITPLLSLGYARPLEAPDLYKLQSDRAAAYIAERINTSFDARRKHAAEYNEKLANRQINPSWVKRTLWSIRGEAVEREAKWRLESRKKPSLTYAINDSVKWWFWTGGALKVVGDTAQVTSPLLVKAIINFATASYVGHRTGGPIPPIGRGIGLTFALLALQIIASLCTHHFFYRATSTGVLLRGGLITAIYSRSLRLTNRARSTLTNGKLVNHISTDVSRIDFCAGFFHMGWTAPIQMLICLALLIINLGPSALAGFGFFVLMTPLQTIVMKRLFALRAKSMVWTDKRAKLLQELLGGMKVIKFFAWEIPFLKRIFDYRGAEMGYIRSLLLIRSANNAVAMSMPVLASVLAFVTYSLTGHSLNPADIFTSLTLFNLLRLPLMFLPMAFSSIADAKNAVNRLQDVFEAELFDKAGTLVVDEDMAQAVEVKGAGFTWDAPPPREEAKSGKKHHGSKTNKHSATKKTSQKDASEEKKEVDPFKVRDLNLTIKRGQFVAIVGPVGAGKTSLLQGVIGEMRRTSGTVKVGARVGYCAQSAWIQNATIRENICFGRPFEEARYWRAVKDACLEPDLAMLPYGDMTEVGERGISLSGGQKQRLNICRTLYSNADIQIYDDPLSALDAHVGRAVFTNVLLGNPEKTRILVTHALHFLPQVDYIYVVADGRIVEQGTYESLLQTDEGAFSKFIKEFGGKEEEEEEVHQEKEAVPENSQQDDDNMKDENDSTAHSSKEEKPQQPTVAGPGIMQAEERNTGAISWQVYKEYSRAGNGAVVLPLLVLGIVLLQTATVMSSYWLVYWQERKWPRSDGFYMGLYAFLGFSQALASFLMGSTFAMLAYFASQHLHRAAIHRVMHAPMSFFETTPLGRIMNRFSKDIDTIDNMLGDSLRMLAATASAILGAIILISIVLPWFLIGVCFVLIIYIYAAMFYRASARELKRLDAVLRSSLYAHFSESLSGLATIRAYQETERFRIENEERIDIENRAYWLTVTNQRWLGIRLDFLGALLTFTVAMLTVGTRFTISPAQTGLVLSYILSVQQAFGWLVRQSAEVENNMNSVERIVHYATAIEQERPHEIPANKPAVSWPAEGRVEMKDVVLSYRPELPPVLKGITMDVHAGEKIGIVGRTGAGKSSIMTALYRLVELTSGTIFIDGVDVSQIGLADLRNGLAIIPQDAVISGTLRTNLDPFNLHDDAALWDALKRSYLVETPKKDSSSHPDDAPSGAQTPVNRFTLDTIIEDEGNNLSIGQRSLVSLARALVKNSKIIILDEATASVDYETDRNIQDTIAYEFHDRTILCIAHRLRTIISYDRICVLDAGRIAEFDAPERLYTQSDSIFRGMCDRSSITLDDIRFARKATKSDTGA